MSTAKHVLLRRQLAEEITSRLQPNGMLPGERELAEQFGVSRMTIRQALRTLREEGLIRSVRGVGTFVAEPQVTKTPATLTSFSEDMRARGYQPGSRLVSAEEIDAPVSIAVEVGVEAGASLYRVERVRLADGIPICQEVVYLPGYRFPRLLDHDLTGSLYELIEKRYGVRLVRAHQQIRAINLGSRLAEMLRVSPRSAALHVKRTTIDDTGLIVERGESVCRGDRYDYSTTVTRDLNH